MGVTVRRVQTRNELKEFVEFPNRLYKGNKCFVPKMFSNEMKTLDPKKNPAFEFCEAACFLACDDEGKTVGRVAAIVNKKANEIWSHAEVRFGWIDFIDDPAVSAALIDKVVEFGKQRGMTRISGPLGFTDFDPEGMLVEGFDQLCTMVLIYNYPYYPRHMEAMGFTKEVDWLEYKIYLPEKVPDKISRIARIIEKRGEYHLLKVTRDMIRQENYGQKIFKLINDAYSGLYNFTPLTPKMIDGYVDQYLGVVNLDYVSLVVDNDGELAAVGITIPSIVNALQSCGGKLLPFGWSKILKSMYGKHEERIEMMLIGVRPEDANKGLISLIFDDLLRRYIKKGFKWAETNAELESNKAMSSIWGMFDYDQTKRRRIYTREI